VTVVDVWSADLDAPPAVDPGRLPAPERERAAVLRLPRVRARWLAARLALRKVLSIYVGEAPERIELRFGHRGKPALADPAAALRFNLSHSGALALIAVTERREVGIDLEERQADRDFLRLAEVGLDAEAATAVRETSPERRAAAFYAAWVRREAVAKCLGAGLGPPLPAAPPVSVCGLEVGGGHAAALAVAGAARPAVRRHSLSRP
jgi:4'-phosphopantetheinyl transferase